MPRVAQSSDQYWCTSAERSYAGAPTVAPSGGRSAGFDDDSTLGTMESSAYTGVPTVGAMAEYDDEYNDDTEEEDGEDDEIGLCLSPVTKVKMEGNVYERGTARGPRTPGEDGSAAARGE